MSNKPDLASDFLNIIDEETKELLDEEKARELRGNINKSLEDKGLELIKWKSK